MLTQIKPASLGQMVRTVNRGLAVKFINDGLTTLSWAASLDVRTSTVFYDADNFVVYMLPKGIEVTDTIAAALAAAPINAVAWSKGV